MREFDVSRIIAILPISLYVFGYIFGPIVAAPLSELYGRRNVYWSTIPLLLIFTGIAGAAQNVEQLIICRFLAGVGGSAALAIGAGVFAFCLPILVVSAKHQLGTVTDIWSDRKALGRASLAFVIAPFLGPALGTLTGAYIIDQYDGDWRYSLWVVMIICAPIAIMACFLKETSKVRILFLRERKRGVKVQHQQGDTKILFDKIRHAVIRPLTMLVAEVGAPPLRLTSCNLTL